MPSSMFSSPLAKYIDEAADVHSIHNDSLAIVLINCVAATLEFSQVLRSNLYNVIVARSSYGKSDLTKMLRDMLKVVADHRPTKFCSTARSAIGHQVNPTLDEMSKAGLLSTLDDCCRILVCDEADMTFADTGLFSTNSSYRTSAEMSCRGLITSLFDRVCHPYIRQLANRTVSVKRSKLNILGCSTGDMISNMVIRMKSGASFDPSVGRFLFWALDGPVIPDKLTECNVDNYVFPCLNQFVLVLSFVENVLFLFDNDAAEAMVTCGNSFKVQSYDERNNSECLSARLGKAVQHAYRFAAFLQTIEIGFKICQDFIQSYQCFPANGSIGNDFVDKVSGLYHLNYPNQFRSNEPYTFRISKDVVLRVIDVITGNMHQFMLLFDSKTAPRASSIGRQVIVVSSDRGQAPLNCQSSSESKKELKRQQRNDFNFNKAAAEMILYPSVCFTLKQLHKTSALHNSGGIRLKEVAKKLVDSDILTVCQHGIKSASKTTPVFIKQLPCEDDEDESYLASALSEYRKDGRTISLDSYKNSCNSFLLLANGVVQDDVYEVLARPEYSTRNFFALFHPRNAIVLGAPPVANDDALVHPEDAIAVGASPIVNDDALLHSEDTTAVGAPPIANDDESVGDPIQHIHPVRNDSEQTSVVDVLSSYMSVSDTSLAIISVKEKENLFQDISLDNIQFSDTFDDILVINRQEVNDANVSLVCDGRENNDLNVDDIDHKEEDNESNLATNYQEENRNTSDISNSDRNSVDNSNNSFSSPPSWRTRSKSKNLNKIPQGGLSNTGDGSFNISHRKRKAKESKGETKKRAASKQD